MSKFLKVIVNLFLVGAILVAAALLVPPLMGISTTMVDSSSMDSNLPIGSVVYSKEVRVAEISVGDKILVESETEAYAYIVESADAGDGNYMVTDTNDSQAETKEITLRNVALKIILMVPLIGYVVIAMRSLEGLIIIGLIVVFVIILFILSELWKNTDDEEDEEDDLEDDDSEDDDLEDGNKKGIGKNQDSESNAQTGADGQAETAESPTADAKELVMDDYLADELARSVAEIQNANQKEFGSENTDSAESVMNNSDPIQSEDDIQEVVTDQEAVEPSEEETEAELDPSEAETVPEDEYSSFVPVERPSKEEILKKAEASNEEPVIIEYEELGITIVDYSDLL